MKGNKKRLGQKRLDKKHRPAKLSDKTIATTQVLIKRLADDGRGIGQLANGKTVFVDQALPGEVVEIAIFAHHSRYDEAKYSALTNMHCEREVPLCPHFAICGGCQLQHMSQSLQLDFRKQLLLSHFAHQRLALTHIEIITAASWQYRRRARLQVNSNNGRINCGFYQRQSHHLAEITQCPILLPRLAELIQPIRITLFAMQQPQLIQAIELAQLTDTVIISLQTKPLRDHDRRLWQKLAQAENVTFYENPIDAINQHHFYTLQLAEQELAVEVSPYDFFQANAAVNHLLVKTVSQWTAMQSSTGVLYDFFAGAGNFSLALARQGWQVIGIEGVKALVDHLVRNGQILQLDNKLQAKQFDLTQSIMLAKADLVLLDPPRSGALALCQQLAQSMIKKIIYVSCHSATLARDARLLCDNGFTIKKCSLFNMFPQTIHSELLLFFERS